MKYFSFILFIFFNLSCENDRTLFSINNVSYSDVEIFKYIEKDVFESLELTEKEIQLRTLAEDFIFINDVISALTHRFKKSNTYNVGFGKPYKVIDVIKILFNLTKNNYQTLLEIVHKYYTKNECTIKKFNHREISYQMKARRLLQILSSYILT